MRNIQKPSTDLLETIWFATGCTYMSDLRSPYFFPVISKALTKIQPSSYDLNLWLDAVYYITGRTISAKTSKEAAHFLEHYLTNV